MHLRHFGLCCLRLFNTLAVSESHTVVLGPPSIRSFPQSRFRQARKLQARLEKYTLVYRLGPLPSQNLLGHSFSLNCKTILWLPGHNNMFHVITHLFCHNDASLLRIFIYGN